MAHHTYENSDGTYYAEASDGRTSPSFASKADAIEYEDDVNECEGHESLRGDSMGVSVYCDGSCVR